MKTIFTESVRQDLREASEEVISKGKTADGVGVTLWSDGAVTGRMGYALKGVPIVRPKTQAKRDAAIRAGFMLMSDLTLYDASELGAAYKAYRWAADRNKNHGQARARFSDGGKKPKGKVSGLKPKWTVLSADRDGKSTERVWRLPRIRWPGLVVLDHHSKGHGGRERYELMSIDRTELMTPTGFSFKNLSDLEKHLQSL